MPIATGLAMIIAAIVAATGLTTSTVLNNAAVDDANEQGLKLANISRQDQLRREQEQNRLSQASLRLQKKQLKFQRETELFGRKERAEEKGYVRRERQFDKQLGLINRNDAIRNQLVSVWRRGK